MNTRWIFSVAAFTAMFFSGSLLATAAAPAIGQDRSPTQASARAIQISTLVGTTVLDSQGQQLGRIKEFRLDSQTGQATFVVLNAEAPNAGRPMTHTVARPIENPSMQAPVLAPSAVVVPSLPPSVMPLPCVNSANSGWTKDLEGFYNE